MLAPCIILDICYFFWSGWPKLGPFHLYVESGAMRVNHVEVSY